MKGFIITALFLIGTGCGGNADDRHGDAPQSVEVVFPGVSSAARQHAGIEVPGQEGRIDGSVWDDGLFNSPEAKAEFCSTYTGGDAWFCDEDQ
jgi:hypothetical protein